MNGSLLLPDDAKKLKKFSDYTDEMKADVQKLSSDFADVGIKLLWDSKVPDKDWWFFHCFSLTASNRDDVLKEIHKYQKFYDELSTAVHRVENPEDRTVAEREDPHGTIINELQEKLSEMHKVAKLGKETTASSAIYHLHKSFIQRHEALQDMITGVETVALKEGYKKAIDRWQKSVEELDDLKSKYNDSKARHDETSTKFDNLMTLHRQLMHDQRNMMNENKELRENQEKLELKCKKMQEEIDKLQKKN